MTGDCVLAGDLGGTHFRAALVDRSARVLSQAHGDIPRPATPRSVLEMMTGVFRAAIGSDARPKRLGLSMKGLIDPERGLCLKVTGFSAWKNVPVIARLKNSLGIAGRIENDAKCAALGEGWAGRAKAVSDYVFVIVGTGIGTGIVHEGRLLRGVNGHAGELGHSVIDAGNRVLRCGCGQWGDLESLAAGPALAARARLRIEAGDKGLARFLEKRGGPLDGLFVTEALRAGIGGARHVVEEAGTALGVGLYNVVRALDPELIVLGGGVSSIGEPFIGPARRECGRRLGLFKLKPPRVLKSSLGDNAGLIGAASLAWRP